MNCIRQEADDILHYGALHFAGDYLGNIDSVSMIVNRDLVDSGIDIGNLSKYRVILDFRGEGQSSTDIENLIAYLRNIPVKQVAAIFNSVVDVKQLDYPAVSVSNYLVNFAGWFDELCRHPMQWHTECDFLCLIRRPSPSRAQLASRLIESGLEVRVSFGGMCNSSELTEYQPLFDQPLPLMLDGPLLRNRDDNQEHRVVSNLLRQCAVNVVAETSAQNEGNAWRGLIVTEKTFKAFGMLQLPIWWAVPGLVDQVRLMGFDVFDDIIDHGYDNIVDQSQRLDAVIEQLHKLSKFDLGSLRLQQKPRLLANWQLLDQMSKQQYGQFGKLLEQLGYA
jgi:hypothetical protein